MIGLGGIGQRHARNLRALLGDELELLAYRTRGLGHVITPQLAADHLANVEEWHGIRPFSTLDEALAEKPDIAFITNPSSLHLELAIACANAGCDLFIEKPLSITTVGVGHLIDIVTRGELIAMVGYQLRFHPCFEAFKYLLASGKLGSILSVHATIGEFLPHWHRYEDYRDMYAARSDLGGGVILSQIHEFDYLYAMFGLPQHLFAIGGHWSFLKIDVEDTADVLMECTFEGRSLPVHVHQDFLQWPPARTCEVVGDRGRSLLNFHDLTVITQIRDEAEPEITSFSGFDRNELFLRELAHFLECVRLRRQPVVSVADGFGSLRIALAVKESIEQRTLVTLSGGPYAA